MQATEKLFFALLQSEVCGVPLPRETHSLSEEDSRELFRLADRQDLAHLLYNALTRNGLLEEGDPAYKSFSKAQLLAVYRTEELTREEAFAKEKLGDEGIACLPLKGAVLRYLYPEPWMRTGCDVDLLVSKEKAEDAEKILLATGRYRVYFRSPHDLSLVTDKGTHIELHKTLSAKGEESGLYSPLLDAISDAPDLGGISALPDDLFYCYHVFHMASHVKIGGCGVRPFLDLWLLNHRLPKKSEARNASLAEVGLLSFAEKAEKLSEVWFSSAESDAFSDAFSSFILSGGVYGSDANAALIEKGQAGGKGRYRLHRIFLPYRELKERYPVLKKHPILFPLVSVWRWIAALFGGTHRKVEKTLAQGEKAEQNLGVLAKDFWSQMGLP